MSRHLNLDDSEALRVRCNLKAPDLFDELREPEVQVTRFIENKNDSFGDRRFLVKTEHVLNAGQLKELNSVRILGFLYRLSY
jgi:hypothetical protein